jgi:hypothetical protein
MLSLFKKGEVRKSEWSDDFNLGATIAVIVLVLFFIGASFYFVVETYLELT